MFGRILTISLILAAFAFTAWATELKISVSPVTENRYRVSITFKGDADGTTTLKLPNEWGGQRELYRSIQNLRAEGASVENTVEEHTKTVSHKPGQRVTMVYDIVQDFRGPLKNSVRYRPVTAGFVHWIGNTVWVLPDWEDQARVDIELEWKGLPAEWTIADSFAAGKRKHKFTALVQELRASLYVAGDFRISETAAAGKPVYVAIRGEWQFKDQELTEMIRRVIESQRSFWKDDSQGYYLVSLVPIDEGQNSFSFGGTGLTDSFALFATQNAVVDRIRGLLAHEYSHNWVPMKMGRMPEPEQQIYWFSEGFNEFYTYRTLLRAEIISRREFVEAYNERIREYYMLPVRTASNERIVNDFWNDPNVQRLPYLRGFLFATNLNAAIEKASGGKRSLDDAMREIAASSKGSKQELSFEYLTGVFGKHLGAEVAELSRRQLIDGEPIVPDAGALGSDIALEMVRLPVFELGFDLDRFGKEKVVAGVDPNSAAYAAGLRDGQIRTGGFSVYFGDTTREIEIKVKDGDEEKTIKFFPVAKDQPTIPQYKLR